MNDETNSEAQTMLVTMRVGEAHFGVPVMQVRDVLQSPPVFPTPLASCEIAGSLNLRGRVVTAIDMRMRLGLPPRPAGQTYMGLVVEYGERDAAEPYALLVDTVSEVIALDPSTREATPETIDPVWSQVTRGLYRQEEALLLVLDIGATLKLGRAAAA